jgi:hypothetical protein
LATVAICKLLRERHCNDGRPQRGSASPHQITSL